MCVQSIMAIHTGTMLVIVINWLRLFVVAMAMVDTRVQSIMAMHYYQATMLVIA